jgi:hypothetical protein
MAENEAVLEHSQFVISNKSTHQPTSDFEITSSKVHHSPHVADRSGVGINMGKGIAQQPKVMEK